MDPPRKVLPLVAESFQGRTALALQVSTRSKVPASGVQFRRGRMEMGRLGARFARASDPPWEFAAAARLARASFGGRIALALQVSPWYKIRLFGVPMRRGRMEMGCLVGGGASRRRLAMHCDFRIQGIP